MRLTAFLLLLLIYMPIAGYDASAQEMRNLKVRCGEKGQSYYAFCQRLKDLVENRCHIELDIKESQGSYDNLKNPPPNDRYTWVLLAQHDTMVYAEHSSEDQNKKIIDNTRFVASLYPEKIHIVSLQESNIQNLAGLKGKIVGYGLPASGTSYAVSLILEDVGVRDFVQLKVREALEQLFSKKLAAFVFVGGAPVPSILGAEDDRKINPDHKKLSFVEIKDVEIKHPENVIGQEHRFDYDMLKPREYPFLERPVSTLSTTAVLATYNYNEEKKCLNVAAIARLIYLNAEKLIRDGQDRWRPNFLLRMPPWKTSACVVRYLPQIVAAPQNDERDCKIEMATETQKPEASASPLRPDCNCKKGHEKELCRTLQRSACPRKAESGFHGSRRKPSKAGS
jgi:uncharacterized protein